MPVFSTPARARGAQHAAIVEELRRLLPRIGSGRENLPFGLPAIDRHLPDGGLAAGALHEVVPETQGAFAAALGFIGAFLGLLFPPPPQGGRIFLILPPYALRDHGRLYGQGVRRLKLDPADLVLIEPATRKDTLWAIEEALHSAAPAAVAAVLDKLDLKSSQRLHLAAADAGLPLFLIRPSHNLESSAAATRWRVGTAEAVRDRFGLLTHPRWRLRLERCRNGRPGEWRVEYDHVAHRFSLAAALADSARARGADETLPAKSHCA